MRGHYRAVAATSRPRSGPSSCRWASMPNTSEIVVSVSYEGFDDLWHPFLKNVGPAGDFVASLEPEAQAAFREQYRTLLGSPDGPFDLSARAWYAVGAK